jgi:precorrin-6B methylase 2
MLLDPQHDLQKLFGLYETPLNPVYEHVIRAESVVYDVGAADGDTTLMFASLANRGKTIAFEPDSGAVDLLTRNLSLNPALAGRVEVVPVELAATGATLDSVVLTRHFPNPNFIKIDVDGPEAEILRGAEQLLLRCRPAVVVEVHSVLLEDACSDILRRMGYVVRVIDHPLWRRLYPEYRPIAHNRWLSAVAQQSF